jgi:putative ABC transport system permease protein
VAAGVEAAVPGVAATPVRRLAESEADVVAMLRSLLAVVAVIVLALTALGVATTTMAVVAERRPEIALRRALGASPRSIRAEFLAEGVLVGVAGGVIGLAGGFAVAWAVSQTVFGRAVGFSAWIGLATVAGSAAVAWLGSLGPVRRAAQTDPADWLREE